MSDWPPKPQQTPEPAPQKNSQAPIGKEWQLLEKAVLASTQEQARARRWSIFFKILTFIYIFVVLAMMTKSCSVEDGAMNKVTGEHLAVVDIIGTIDANSPKGVNSADTNEALQQAFKSSHSKAVVLNINSPGGSPVQSDEIYQQIRDLKQKYSNKKVYAVIGDTGASGAYYIAAAADEIWVNPSSIVGSIGVIMPNYGVDGLLQKWGISDRTMTAGENKAILSMTKPIDEKQRQHIQSLLNNVHQHFINAVKQGRGDRLKDNPEIFSGLFWTGEQAIALGVADKAGGMQQLKKELKVEHTVNYTVQRNELQQLLGGLGVVFGQGLSSGMAQQMQSQQDVQLK